MKNLPESKLVKHQAKRFTKEVEINGKLALIEVEIRYDDECGNGHNSFAITGSIYEQELVRGESRRKLSNGKAVWWSCGGCIHDEIIKFFPEFADLIQWHLCSSDGPMHYVANTTYHAQERTHMHKKIGDPVAFDTRFKFSNIPFTFKQQFEGFWAWLDTIKDFKKVEIESVPYDGADSYDYSDNYSLTGFIPNDADKKWYEAPFKSRREAVEFLQALKEFDYEYIETPTAFCKAVEPDLKAARSCAIWKKATLKQLQSEKVLKRRLPALINRFKKAVESIGFIY